MPKRKATVADDLTVERVACVVIGAMKTPVPIPLLLECGVTCVTINSTDTWLNKVVGDRIRSDRHFVIKNFIAGLLSALSAIRSDEEDVGRQRGDLLEETAEETARRLAGGEKVSQMALLLEDDSDVDALNETPMEEDKEASARNRRQERKVAEFRKVTYRGLELSVKARDKGRGVVVPLEGGSLETVLRHLREQVQGPDAGVLASGVCTANDEGARRRRRVVLESREDVDGGRIRWLFGPGCYQVWFEGADGKMHQTSKGLNVARADPLGQPLGSDIFKRAKDLALHKARALWNECDRSEALRYEEIIPEESR